MNDGMRDGMRDAMLDGGAPLDPRIHAHRPEIADARLKGRVDAERFVEGLPCRVRAGFATLAEAPDFDARTGSQLLFGEVFTVFEEVDGWAWGQNGSDDYVGWVRIEALDADVPAVTHKVTALRSYLFPEPDLKAPPIDLLSLEARLAVVGDREGWLELAGGGFIFAKHVVELGAAPADPVEVAGRLMGTPYLWGGRTSLGLDCSALVQLSLAAAGRSAPRDSDLQAAALGLPVEIAAPLRAGDLVFFPGHVGMMADGVDLIHANAFHMAVTREPLAEVVARAGAKGISAIKRLPPD